MLDESQRSRLLNAVPSFQPVWERELAEQRNYESRFPRSARTAAEWSHEFLFRLSWHLGPLAHDTAHAEEFRWLFAALEPMLASASDDVWNALTIGFLEGLNYSIDDAGGRPEALDQYVAGPATREAWQCAYWYTHPEMAPDGWRFGRRKA